MRSILLAVFASWSFVANAADWPPATDYLNSGLDCATTKNVGSCHYSKEEWPDEYGAAIKGDYQGQRNVSYCLSTGCNGAIRENRILGCAWRFVIVESGHLSADSSDTTNLEYYCGPEYVDKAGLAMAEAQARRLIKMIKP